MEKLYTPALYGEFISGIAVLVLLLFVSAPYGKHSRKGWGISIQSKRAWMHMELPVVLTIFCMFLYAKSFSIVTIVLLLLWEIHYLYRSFVYSSLLRGSKKSFPLVLLISATVFNINNGFINGYSLFSESNYAADYLLSVAFIGGLALFIIGFLMHIHSDHITRQLRSNGDSGYKIPYGGLFRFISNPNYLGEIIEWIGFAILTQSAAGWAFAVFTFCNLFPRAIANHKWYKQQFENYPVDRKILIPYIF